MPNHCVFLFTFIYFSGTIVTLLFPFNCLSAILSAYSVSKKVLNMLTKNIFCFRAIFII